MDLDQQIKSNSMDWKELVVLQKSRLIMEAPAHKALAFEHEGKPLQVWVPLADLAPCTMCRGKVEYRVTKEVYAKLVAKAEALIRLRELTEQVTTSERTAHIAKVIHDENSGE